MSQTNSNLQSVGCTCCLSSWFTYRLGVCSCDQSSIKSLQLRVAPKVPASLSGHRCYHPWAWWRRRGSRCEYVLPSEGTASVLASLIDSGRSLDNPCQRCQSPHTAMRVLTDSPFFAPPDGVNAMPTDDNDVDLTN